MARPVAYAGPCLSIVYATLLDGSSPAKTFFEDLPRKEQIRFGVAFKKLGDTGKLYNREQFKVIEGTQFYEFKCHQHRLICRFLQGRLVLLINGFVKKKNKIDPAEIKRAEHIYEEDKLAASQGGQKTRPH
jgi:phage-related protein